MPTHQVNKVGLLSPKSQIKRVTLLSLVRSRELLSPRNRVKRVGLLKGVCDVRIKTRQLRVRPARFSYHLS
jgi:hypothetical protein